MEWGDGSMLDIFKRLRSEESGQSLIMVVLLLGVLLSFSALVVDVGLLYAEKARLQNAADAAALAGAQALPNYTLAEGAAVTYAGSNGVTSSAVDVTVPYGDNTKVKVEVENEVPYIFANFLNLVGTGTTVSASAVAQKNPEWTGEALPFINLDDDYLKDSKIEGWEKTGPGDFESLWPDEYNPPFNAGKDDDHSKTYFVIDYSDGIMITKGTVATIKQEVGYIYEQHKPLYIFSLSSEAIKKGTYNSVKNKDIIPLADLVLLQVTFDSYDYSGKTLYLTVTKVYDIKNGVFPTDYLNDNSAGTSSLIE